MSQEIESNNEENIMEIGTIATAIFVVIVVGGLVYSWFKKPKPRQPVKRGDQNK